MTKSFFFTHIIWFKAIFGPFAEVSGQRKGLQKDSLKESNDSKVVSELAIFCSKGG